MKSIEADYLRPDALPGVKPHAWDAVSNSSKYCIMSGTQLIQLYKFVCTISTQNINTHHKTKFANYTTGDVGHLIPLVIYSKNDAPTNLLLFNFEFSLGCCILK